MIVSTTKVKLVGIVSIVDAEDRLEIAQPMIVNRNGPRHGVILQKGLIFFRQPTDADYGRTEIY